MTVSKNSRIRDKCNSTTVSWGVGMCVGFILFNLLISLKSFFLFPFEITGPSLNVYCEKINDVCKDLTRVHEINTIQVQNANQNICAMTNYKQ